MLNSGLLTTVDENLLGKVSKENLLILRATTLLYFFGGCKKSAIKALSSRLQLDWDYPEWKRKSAKNGDLMKNSKMFLFAYVKGEEPTPKEFGVSIKEANALKSCLAHQPLNSYLTRLSKKFPTLRSPQHADRIYSRVISNSDLKTYTQKYVYVKLRFLANSYGYTLEELSNLLLAGCYFSLLKQYPAFQDKDHLIKLAKTVVHNTGMNLIKSMTREKRNQLDTDEKGNVTAVTSSLTDDNLSFDASSSSDFVSKSFLVAGIDGASQSNWEQTFALRELIQSHRLDTRQKSLLALLMGSPSQEFQDFLGEPQEDLYEQDWSNYFSRVCQFLNVSTTKASAFLTSLKPHL